MLQQYWISCHDSLVNGLFQYRLIGLILFTVTAQIHDGFSQQLRQVWPATDFDMDAFDPALTLDTVVTRLGM
jgi:hypothetical protein